MRTAKWMLDFIFWKPSEGCGWDDASAEEIFQFASLADHFQLIELQDMAGAMLSALPLEKEDILEVASIAVHFEVPFPTALCPIGSPLGDLGPLGDLFVDLGPL